MKKDKEITKIKGLIKTYHEEIIDYVDDYVHDEEIIDYVDDYVHHEEIIEELDIYTQRVPENCETNEKL